METTATGQKLSFVIPAYNEVQRLPRSLSTLLAYFSRPRYNAEFLVVDDGSNDATAEVVRSFAEKDSRVMLVQNLENRGKGYSVRRGGLTASGDIILLVDADLCLPVAELRRLIRSIRKGAHVAIGSRRKNGLRVSSEVPILRRITSFGMRTCTRSLLGLRYQDTQCGFKALDRSAAHAIFPLLQVDGWGFDPEMLVLCEMMDFKVDEIALDVGHDNRGSKVRVFRDSVRVLRDLFHIWLRANTGAYHRTVPALAPESSVKAKAA